MITGRTTASRSRGGTSTHLRLFDEGISDGASADGMLPADNQRHRYRGAAQPTTSSPAMARAEG